MKKNYIAPELEYVELSLIDVILSSPTEGNVPIGGGDDPFNPDDDELD